MASESVKVSALGEASNLQETDSLYVVQNGNSKRTTVGELARSIGSINGSSGLPDYSCYIPLPCSNTVTGHYFIPTDGYLCSQYEEYEYEKPESGSTNPYHLDSNGEISLDGRNVSKLTQDKGIFVKSGQTVTVTYLTSEAPRYIKYINTRFFPIFGGNYRSDVYVFDNKWRPFTGSDVETLRGNYINIYGTNGAPNVSGNDYTQIFVGNFSTQFRHYAITIEPFLSLHSNGLVSIWAWWENANGHLVNSLTGSWKQGDEISGLSTYDWNQYINIHNSGYTNDISKLRLRVIANPNF